MPEPRSGGYESIARRWLALIERRQKNFLDMCDTGRWRHYYTEAEFLDEMRKVLKVRDRWATLAGILQDDERPMNGVEPRRPQFANGSALGLMPAAAWPD